MAVSNVVQLPALGNPSIDQMNSAQDHIYGWASAWATVKVHVHGVFIRDVQADGSGRWVTHLGFERGNAIVESQQRYVGRPWSGWSRMVVQQLQMPQPTINYIDSSHYWVSRKRRTRSNSKTTCSWCCNKRYRSRWSTETGQHILEDNHQTEE